LDFAYDGFQDAPSLPFLLSSPFDQFPPTQAASPSADLFASPYAEFHPLQQTSEDILWLDYNFDETGQRKDSLFDMAATNDYLKYNDFIDFKVS
jgi:hypothetical protein